MRGRKPSCYRRKLAGWATILIVAFAAASQAQQTQHPHSTPINVLDGKTFAGKFIPIEKSSGRPDKFIFKDGTFHSEACLNWGFKPGPYWVRMRNGQVHFLAELTSTENGVMTYQGTVAGSKIDAKIDWIKPRWYWPMKRQFRFLGIGDKTAAKNGS